MKVIKPLTLGILQKPYRFAGRHRLVVATLGFFRLGAENRHFLTENLQWPAVMERLPADQPLDMVMPKPQREALAAATAYAPGGEPVERMEVRLACGDIDKRLAVIGDREWLYGAVPLHRITAPVPFTVMPIGWERAYGGETYDRNPLGRGYAASPLPALIGENQGRMPNIEYPGRPVRGHRKRLEPAGFGPIDLRWQPRASKGGTYDDKWLENDFPGLPRDIDWSLFNAAPEDQRRPGRFEGGEPYRLEGMHPEHPVIEGRLPELRARAFVHYEGAAPERCEEVELACDTVWFFPDAELGVMIHRGEAPLEDSDALDVASLMIAYERNGDAPRPVEHYREVLRLRIDPESAPAHLFNESQLTPEHDAAEREAREAAQARAEAEELARRQEALDAADGDLRAAANAFENPVDAPSPKAELPPLGVIPDEAIRSGDFDLSALLERAKGVADEAKADGERRMQELEEARARLPEALGREADEAPEGDAEEARAQAIEEALERAATKPEEDPDLKRLLEAAKKLSEEERQRVEASIRELPAQKREGRRAALTPTREPLPAAVATALGEAVLARLAAGESLAGHDLAGADLNGADLTGVDLREAMLERADLSGARLAGANLQGAVLTGANLEGADLGGARLERANLCGVKGSGAVLRQAHCAQATAFEARLDRADLTGADLTGLVSRAARLEGAVLDGADLTQALFIEATADGSSWRGAHLRKTIFTNARLASADFSGTRIEESVFADVTAPGMILNGARAERLFAVKGKLAGADLGGMEATMSSWRDADLSGARLDDGRFLQCDFGEADLTGASLRRTLLHRSILMRGRLERGDLRDAELFQSLCRKGDFRHADLRGAGLTQADCSEALFDEARLRGARDLPREAAA